MAAARPPGFTLIEVMIALVIYSTLMTVVVHSIHTVNNLDRYSTTRSKADRAVDEDVLEEYLTQRTMAEDFRNLVRPPLDQDQTSVFVLSGEGGLGAGGGSKDGLGFWVAVQRPFAIRGVHWVEYKVDEDTGQILRRVTDRLGIYARGATTSGTKPATVVPEMRYLSGLKTFAFKFSHDGRDAVRDWKRQELPRYVHLSIEFEDGARKSRDWVFPIGLGD